MKVKLKKTREKEKKTIGGYNQYGLEC
jgi:hypothetical protein